MSASLPTLPEVRLLPLGDAALTVEFGSEIEPQSHARVLGISRSREEISASWRIAGVFEWVPTDRSVTVY
ncbi:MAG: carboxyltransferase domain-containing protein, partial [Rhodoferax sp.]